MNKVGCFLCFSLMTVNAWATEMCARNDTIVIPLDATIAATAGSTNSYEWLWRANFEYGAIYGASACLSKKEIMMYNNGVMPAVYQPINTSSDDLIASSSYYMNANTDTSIPATEKPDYERKYCFRKLIHPISSMWIYMYGYSVADSGAQYTCTSHCNVTATDTLKALTTVAKNERNALFSNIAIEQPK